MAKKLYILNGPNLNLLGTREPEIYGSTTLDELAAQCKEAGEKAGLDVDFRQTNHEGELVEWIQGAIDQAAGIIINAAALTHTSVAVHDALRAYKGYKIELHISNPHSRESFRQVSYVSPVVDAVIVGLGVRGYALSVELMAEKLAAGANRKS
ncbi:MAG TPA: type II 3-dehydroquinate dehydratase [Woeseiaceae bacterium]